MFHMASNRGSVKPDRITVFVIFCVSAMHTAMAEEVKTYVSSACAGCHVLTEDGMTKTDVSERMYRKGPPLYYAGDKFRQDWLERWLADPVRIRPGGAFPPDHTVVTDDGDVIDSKTLTAHIALPEDKAEAVAAYLMGLRAAHKPALEESYSPQKVSRMLGSMNFNKFKGCSSCHRDEEDTGGQSGPELYTAWTRMQPEFIVSYTRDPAAWDPHTMMPDRHLKEKEIHKLVDYLKLIGEAAQ